MRLSRVTTGAASQRIAGKEEPLAPKAPNIKDKAVFCGAINALFNIVLAIVKCLILMRKYEKLVITHTVF